METPNEHNLKAGQRYSSLKAFLLDLEKLQMSTGQVFTISGNQRKLDSASCKIAAVANIDCVYHWVTFSCKFGTAKEESSAIQKQTR